MPERSYVSNHRVKYGADDVPVTDGTAEVDYEIAFTYEYSIGDRTTPSYGDVRVDDVAIEDVRVFPGVGLRRPAPEVNHEKVSQELDAMLGSGPLPDIDEWNDGPIPANERQKKDAMDYFWKDLVESEELREHLLAMSK